MISYISYCYQGIKSLLTKETCYVKCSISSNCCQHKDITICDSAMPIPSRLHKFILRTRTRAMQKNQSCESINNHESKDNCFNRLITW